MLKVVLDTNILVSSVFWSGASYKIVKLITKRKIESYTSIVILNELRRVLKSKIKYDLPEAKVQEIIELIKIHSVLAYPKKKISIAKDPKDNKFIECAIAAKVDYIISGDKHLLILKKYKKIRIVAPSKFLEISKQSGSKKGRTPKKSYIKENMIFGGKMKCSKCGKQMAEKKAETPEGISYSYYKCRQCGEEILDMKQLHTIAEKYRKIKHYNVRVTK